MGRYTLQGAMAKGGYQYVQIIYGTNEGGANGNETKQEIYTPEGIKLTLNFVFISFV